MSCLFQAHGSERFLMENPNGVDTGTLHGSKSASGPASGTERSSILSRLRFDRLELAGSFGDLGTLLPIVVGMILINKLSPTTVFLAFGLFYIFTGYYYRLPVPVQPLKAVGAIAIAYPAQITEPVIGAAGIIFGGLLLVFSLTGFVDKLAKLFTQPVVRGIQLALGLIFLRKGIELIVDKNLFLSGVAGRFPDSYVNLILGVVVFGMVLALLDNKKLPAAIAAVAVGIISGLALGGLDGPGFSIGPTEMRFISPSLNDFWIAFIMLILPQMPLTIGNACVGTADTCYTLFPNRPAAFEGPRPGNSPLPWGSPISPQASWARSPCAMAPVALRHTIVSAPGPAAPPS